MFGGCHRDRTGASRRLLPAAPSRAMHDAASVRCWTISRPSRRAAERRSELVTAQAELDAELIRLRARRTAHALLVEASGAPSQTRHARGVDRARRPDPVAVPLRLRPGRGLHLCVRERLGLTGRDQRFAHDVQHGQASGLDVARADTQATASVVPSASATTGSASSGTVAAKTRCTPWKSSCRPVGAVPSKWSSCTASSSPTAHSTPHSSRTSRTTATRGDSPWSIPPPGSVHAPGWAPRVGDPGQQHRVVALDQGVRRDPLHPERPVVGQRLHHHRRHRDGAVEHVGDRLPGGLDGRPVDLQHPRLRRVHRHPPVVHDPQRVRVDPPPFAPDARQVGGVDPRRVADHRPPARSPRGPRGPPRRRGSSPWSSPPPGRVHSSSEVMRGESRRQQDLVVAQDHGVRRDPLALRKASPHGPNLGQLSPRPAAPAGPTSARPRCAAPRPAPQRLDPVGRVPAEVGGVPRRVLPRPRAGARAAAAGPRSSWSAWRRTRASTR